jgi:diguanylate cyclase (GGDEF)-like protein
MTTISSMYDRELLSRLDLFRNVDLDAVLMLLDAARTRELAPGEVLLSPGTPNEHLFVILQGQLLVHLQSVDEPALTDLQAGECVGEMSIIDEETPSAFVVAGEATSVLVIDRDTTWSLINTIHGVARNLLFVLTKRVRYDNVVILDRTATQRELEQYATIDTLTGVHNRRWLQQAFDREAKRCRMDRRPLSLVMLDVDHFKRFNDAFGHLAGDRALCAVARALRHRLRPNDMVARYGGEEFVILFPDTSIERTFEIADRVRAGIAASPVTEIDGAGEVRVTVSMGVTDLLTGDTLESTLARADGALYEAKAKGRNQVVVRTMP